MTARADDSSRSVDRSAAGNPHHRWHFRPIYRQSSTNPVSASGPAWCWPAPSCCPPRPRLPMTTPSTWPARSRCSTRRRSCMTTSATVHSCDAIHRRLRPRSVSGCGGEAGFHLAGTALHVAARVLADNPTVFVRLGRGPRCHVFRPAIGPLVRSAHRDPATRLRRRGAAPALRTRGQLRRPARCSGWPARTAARRAASTMTGCVP